MAYPKSVSESIKLMQDQTAPLTFGWDVVVNYSVDAINKLLQKTFEDKSQKHITDVEFEISAFDDRAGEFYYIRYKFELGAPLLQFHTRSAQGASCQLSIPIVGGSVEIEGFESKPTVPAGVYMLVLSYLKLATARGSWDSDTKHQGKLFYFDEEVTEGCVVIDLPTSNELGVEIAILSSGDANIQTIDNHTGDMEKAVKKLLLSPGGVYQDVRYEIARINSHTPGGAYQLQPRSFLFDAFLPSESSPKGDVGVLSLFVQTQTVNHGRQHELFTAWENQWRVTVGCSPIPEGKTASIILYKETLWNSMLPAIQAHGYEAKRIDEGPTIKMEIETHSGFKRDPWESQPEIGSSTIRHVDGVQVTLPPLQLELTEHGSSGAAVLTWKFSYNYGWFYFYSGLHTQQMISGSVTVSIEAADPYRTVKLDDRHLEVDCSVPSSGWKITFTPDKPDFWSEIWGATAARPSWAEAKVNIPGFRLELLNVNFFLTTNLLFPGDKQVINVDKDSGLHIPGDFFLVGDVVDK